MKNFFVCGLAASMLFLSCGSEKQGSEVQSDLKSAENDSDSWATSESDNDKSDNVQGFSIIDTKIVTGFQSAPPASSCKIWSDAVSKLYGRTLYDDDFYESANTNESRCIGAPGSDSNNWKRVYTGRGFDHATWSSHGFPSGSVVSATFRLWKRSGPGRMQDGTLVYKWKAWETMTYSVTP